MKTSSNLDKVDISCKLTQNLIWLMYKYVLLKENADLELDVPRHPTNEELEYAIIQYRNLNEPYKFL